MKPEQPMFLITMQIPVRPDTDVSEVLDVIGRQLAEAVRKVQEQADEQFQRKLSAIEPATIVDDGWRETVVKEVSEPLTEATHIDVLTAMGYAAEP